MKKEEKDIKGGKNSKVFIWLVVVVLAVLFISGFFKKQGYQIFFEKEPFFISFGKISPISLVIVEDQNCSFCQIADIENAFKENFRFLKISKVSSESEDGKMIINEQKIFALPAFIFSKEIEKDKKGEEFISRQILKKSEQEKYILSSGLLAGASFFTRDIKENHLDLFIMSECPFGTQAADTIIKYLKNNSEKGIDLTLHYILSFDDNKKLVSLHGEEEVREDLIQIVVQKYHPDKFFDYILTRNSGKMFEEAGREIGLDIEEINKKVEEEGGELGGKEISLSEELEISASPTILWKNRYLLQGVQELGQIEEFSGIEEYFNQGASASTGACE